MPAPVGRRSPRLALSFGCDELESPRGGRAVVVGEPEGEIDERRRQLVEDALDRRRLDAGRCGDSCLDDDAPCRGAAEADRDDRADADVARNLVRERARDGAGGDKRIDLCEGHVITVTAPVVV